MYFDRIAKMIEHYYVGDISDQQKGDRLTYDVTAVIDAYQISGSARLSDALKKEAYLAKGVKALKEINEFSYVFYSGYIFNPKRVSSTEYLLTNVGPALKEEKLCWQQKQLRKKTFPSARSYHTALPAGILTRVVS